jgi:S1-C subfamily serine protease
MRRFFSCIASLLPVIVNTATDDKDKSMFTALKPESVRVSNHTSGIGEVSHGTGFWYSEGGIAVVVTAKHCIDKTPNTTMAVEDSAGKRYKVYQTIEDPDVDVAILYVGDIRKTTMQISPATLSVGESVWLAGYPFGYGLTLCKGIMTNMDYFIKKWKTSTAYLSTLSAAPGCSGGAVVNEKGEIVGMFVMYNPENSNYTILVPNTTLRNSVKSLMQKVKRELAK